MQSLPFELLKPVTFLADEIVEESVSQQIHLTEISVNGGDTFSNSFYQKLMSPLLESSDCTLKQLISNIAATRSALEETHVFKNVGVSVNSDFTTLLPVSTKVYGSDKPIATRLVFDVTPYNLYASEGLLNINSEDNLNIGLNHSNGNFKGNAESVGFGVDYNPYKPNDRLLARARFVSSMKDPAFKFVMDLQHGLQNNQAWQMASEAATFGSVGLQRAHCPKLMLYTGMAIVKRTLRDIQEGACDQTKACAGDTLKTSVISRVSYDSLNYTCGALPSSGHRSSIEAEASSTQRQGQDGQSSFVKGLVSSELYRGFFNSLITANIAGSAGVIHSLANAPVHVSDRFYLGGLNSFQGFAKKAVTVGGGNQFFLLRMTLLGVIPKFIYRPPGKAGVRDSSLRWFIAGQVGNVDKNILRLNLVASSVGAGVKYIHDYVNFEAGYYIASRLNSISQAGIKEGLLFSVTVGGTNRDH